MTETRTLIDEYTTALRTLNEATTRAADPKISIDERMRRVKDLDPHWEALMAVQKKVDDLG